MYTVPLTTSPNSTFTSKITFKFFLRYNTESKCWMMDLSDSSGNSILSSIPLVCGCNLLEQYSYLNIGSAYIYKVDTTLEDDRPDDTNLGTSFALVWGDTI